MVLHAAKLHVLHETCKLLLQNILQGIFAFKSRGPWDQEESTCGKMAEGLKVWPLFLKVALQEHTFDVQHSDF